MHQIKVTINVDGRDTEGFCVEGDSLFLQSVQNVIREHFIGDSDPQPKDFPIRTDAVTVLVGTHHPKYGNEKFSIRVRPTYGDGDRDKPTHWAASEEKLGTGKTRTTIESAVSELLFNNGRTWMVTL